MCRDQVSNPGPLALKSDALHARQLLVYDDLAPYKILKFQHKYYFLQIWYAKKRDKRTDRLTT